MWLCHASFWPIFPPFQNVFTLVAFPSPEPMGHAFENMGLCGIILEWHRSAKRKELDAHSDHSHGMQQM